MDASDGMCTIGQRLRRIRKLRRKSLQATAELAGMNRMTLSRIERGERPLDSRSEIVALANALRIAPSELTKLAEPAAGDGKMDVAVKAVRHAVTAVSRNRFTGQVLPVEVLRAIIGAGLVAVAESDGFWELCRMSLTDTGKARYAVLSEQFDPRMRCRLPSSVPLPRPRSVVGASPSPGSRRPIGPRNHECPGAGRVIRA